MVAFRFSLGQLNVYFIGNLKHYLEKVRCGTAVNYHAFLKHLPSSIARRHAEVFATKKVALDRWLVECRDPAMLAELTLIAKIPGSRLAAAEQGDSHRHVTDTAFLLVYHEHLADKRPEVVYLSKGRCLQGFSGKPAALVIENEQNFARQCLGSAFNLGNTDVVLGGGNRITRGLCADWLGQYQQVICAFQYDLGGLRTFESLARRLDDKAVYLQPSGWTVFYKHFRRTPITTARFIQAIELAVRLGFVGLSKIFRETGHFMEQEILLEHDSEQ